LTLDRVILYIASVIDLDLSTYKISWKSKKLCGRADENLRSTLATLLGRLAGVDLKTDYR